MEIFYILFSIYLLRQFKILIIAFLMAASPWTLRWHPRRNQFNLRE